ncbi:PiggyBac transposable element-derived protein 4 [Phytophthora citrophthora]|uniref:PiggyBac transposable element-derived protein 4 n=1 Tax=Phytophthora citrophthora TaxID=4793 RepID=A0AAD9GYX3_9STRA|nr:PiggyBac transposable element-derived protein 4 [Phytophthora citrophthora]
MKREVRMPPKTPRPRETRSEHQRFVRHLEGRPSAERKRMMQEHAAFLAGDREDDMAFDDDANPPSASTPRPQLRPPTGKDVSYLRAQKRTIAQQRQAVAAKTVAGSGKKTPARRTKTSMTKSLHEEFVSEEDDDDDDDEEDGDYEDEEELVGEEEELGFEEERSPTNREPRARRRRRDVRRAAAEQCCIATAAAEVDGTLEHARVRKTIEESKKKKKKKKKNLQVESTTSEASPGTVDIAEIPPSSVASATRYNFASVGMIQHVLTDDVVCHVGLNSMKNTQLVHRVMIQLMEMTTDCKDAEAEISFYNDGEELQRPKARNGDETADDEGSSSDEDSSEETNAEVRDDGTDLNEIEPAVADSDIGGLSREWRELRKDEMVAFAQDDESMKAMRTSGWEFDPAKFPPDEKYPNLAPAGFIPVFHAEEGLAVGGKRVGPNLTARDDRMYEKQRTPGKTSREEFMVREAKKDDIEPHEIMHVLGLLMAQMLNPQRRRFRDHWSTERVGAVPRGTFNDYMPRHRFEHNMANLHITNNADVRAASDRAWKVRSVIDTLQKRFPRGYITPPVISFDEGIIPSRNRKNPTRQYLKAKPHKWGIKLFLTLEVYCGKAQHAAEVGNVPESQRSADPNTGPCAVIRNLEAVLPAPQNEVYHLVVTDRFYTSVQLAFQLLQRNVFSIGTILGDRVGYPQEIVEKNRDRPQRIEHGATRVAVARNCALVTGLVWWDRKPVQFLGTGSSRAMETCRMYALRVGRRTRGTGGRRHVVPCPAMVRDYYRWMGGVDIHDQFRLQQYSLQLQTWCKKYYKAIVIRLVEVAIVNAYIVFREAQKRMNLKQASHAEFLLNFMPNSCS